MKRLEARISGRVQGVGFRYSTQRQARRLGLDGWVRNDPDGSVSVVAEGPEPDIKSFEQWLKKGPPGARVETVDSRTTQARGDLGRFRVAV